MTSLRELTVPARAALPAASLARWASIFFSSSVLTFLISLAAAEAFLAAASVAYFAHLLRDRPVIKFPPVKVPLALFCLTTLVSVGYAANPAAGGFAVRKLALFWILLLAANLIVSAAHLVALYKALFLESALAGLVATAQFVREYRTVRALHPQRVYFYMTTERISGFMGHWMNFGGQQMLIFAALAAFLLLGARPAPDPPASRAPRSASRGWWVVLTMVALSIVLNFTRGVWLGCFVATLYLVGRWRPRWLWTLPVLLVLGYLAAPSLVRQRVNVLRHPGATRPSPSASKCGTSDCAWWRGIRGSAWVRTTSSRSTGFTCPREERPWRATTNTYTATTFSSELNAGCPASSPGCG